MKKEQLNMDDSEVLDTVRKLRNYIVNVDNTHLILTKLDKFNDVVISETASALMPELISVNSKISALLKQIEISRPYKDMAKRFNIEVSNDE